MFTKFFSSTYVTYDCICKVFEYVEHNPIFWLDKGYEKMIVEQETFPIALL